VLRQGALQAARSVVGDIDVVVQVAQVELDELGDVARVLDDEDAARAAG